MEHWTNDFSHESLGTLQEQQAFKQAMGKYKSQDDGLIGGFNAIREVGKPFKLPESLEKLPEDSRSEFTSQAMKLLGMDAGVKAAEELGDINWTKGMPAGSTASDPLIKAFSEFAVANALPKPLIQALVEFSNTYNMGALEKIKNETDQTTKDNIDKSSKMLLGYFGEKGLTEHMELARRVFADAELSKLTPEECEAVANELTEETLKGKSVFTKGLLNILAPLAKEGKTEPSGPGGPVTPKKMTTVQELPKTAKVLGWDK